MNVDDTTDSRLYSWDDGKVRTYRPRSNAFWYGVVCGICVATSAVMFMIVTRLLGIWS